MRENGGRQCTRTNCRAAAAAAACCGRGRRAAGEGGGGGGRRLAADDLEDVLRRPDVGLGGAELREHRLRLARRRVQQRLALRPRHDSRSLPQMMRARYHSTIAGNSPWRSLHAYQAQPNPRLALLKDERSVKGLLELGLTRSCAPVLGGACSRQWWRGLRPRCDPHSCCPRPARSASQPAGASTPVARNTSWSGFYAARAM